MGNNRSWLWGIVGAVLAVVVTLGVVRLLADNDGVPASGDPTSGTPSETETTPSEQKPPEESTFTVAAYYLGETERGPRLFREFLPARGENVADAAVNVAISGGLDADYQSPWKTTGVRATSVTGDGSLVTLDLEGDPEKLRDRPSSLDPATASLALEQLVRTAQGALKVGRAPVRFLVNGEPVESLLGEPATEPVASSEDDAVLAHVWINTPSDGAQVSQGSEVEGLANSFEANVTWELRQGDTVVETGFTTAAGAYTMAPYSFQLPDVPPGDYTLVVSEDDPSGGEGSGPDFDTRDITIG